MESRRSVNSLEALSAAQAIQKLLDSSQPVGLFADLEPVQQSLIFKYLLTDYKALLDQTEQIERLKPVHTLDLKLIGIPSSLIEAMYKRHTKPLCEPLDPPRTPAFLKIENETETETENETESEDSIEMESNLESNLHYLLSEWQYTLDGNDSPPCISHCWDTLKRDVFCPSMEADFQLVSEARTGFFLREPLSPFQYRISSQLLYYRLTTTFGMPPRVSAGIRAWHVELQHSDGSVLILCDSKGTARAWFEGSGKGSDSALELLDYLTGMTCKHPYGMIAGRVA